MQVKYRKRILFILLLFIIGLFFLWSGLILVSLIIIVLAEVVTIKFTTTFLKKKLPNTLCKFLKYSFYLVAPILVAIFVRTFFFDVYFVPSSSMERTLFPNDYVLINKITYGTKVPKRIQDIPVIGVFFKKNGSLFEFDLYKSLKPFKAYNQGDIVVFKSIEENDMFLIKRIIGMPGDTLKIENAKVFINQKKLKEKGTYCYSYVDSTKKGVVKTFSNKEFNELNSKERNSYKKKVKINPSKKRRNNLFPYPLASKKRWTRDNYGEIVIPKKGMTIILNGDNFDLYRTLIYNFENKELNLEQGEELEYTFLNNYYFMMGDNRHSSLDSRSFGFIPESYIQGKMIVPFSRERLFN